MTIPLKQVIQAIEEANEVFTSFWDTKTGKTVYLADPLMADLTEEAAIQAYLYHASLAG